MAEKRTEVARQQNDAALREPWRRGTHEVGLIGRFADEMDRIFDDFGIGRSWTPLWRQTSPSRDTGWDLWTPNVEIFQRGSELVVRADLPGLNRNDVKVDVTDDAITIQGERKREQEEERGGVYRSERSYGSFRRVIALPEGAITDQAKASFRDGVLEVTMPAPPEHVTRGRRLEISEGPSGKQ